MFLHIILQHKKNVQCKLSNEILLFLSISIENYYNYNEKIKKLIIKRKTYY